MIDLLVLATFAPAALALNLTPGADMLFCLAQGARGGVRAAWAASAGIAAGAMVNVTLAGLGLGAVVAGLPAAFDAIRLAGVAYLLWLAWKTLRAPLTGVDRPGVRPARAFRDAMIVNLTNPKVILFILAFLPQFVDPARAVLPQFLILGAVLSAGGLLVNGLVGQFSGKIGRWLSGSPRLERWQRRGTAGLFGGVAVWMLVEMRR